MISRKIIHVDMDCFYAAIEMRDHPEWRNRPIAVGGSPSSRGVLCTSNYVARQFGVRSAMSSAYALRLCPELLILPVNMQKYRQVSRAIRHIFTDYTEEIEPLSLDEAYLDVTYCSKHCNSATLIAQEIRQRIWQTQSLTASAGVAPNKFLAKVASDWHKPNGQFVITPQQVDAFVVELPVEKIWGVGRVTTQKLHQMGIKTCADLQKYSLDQLLMEFGRFGQRLYELARGIDDRSLETTRIRKSVSVEQTYPRDLPDLMHCWQQLPQLFQQLLERLERHEQRTIHKQFIKIKFNDFQLTTVETVVHRICIDTYRQLLSTGFVRYQKPVRLLGLGVGFAEPTAIKQYQLDFS